MKVAANEYLKSLNIDLKRVAKRFVFILYKMNLFIEQNNLNKKVEVNRRMLAEAVHDYFVDTKRILPPYDRSKKPTRLAGQHGRGQTRRP